MSGIIGGAGSRSGVIGTTELDYEEGEWEPGPMSTGWVSSVTTAKYIKVGKMVTLYVYLPLTTVSGTGMKVGGFPFTGALGSYYPSTGVDTDGSGSAAIRHFRIDQSNNYMKLYSSQGAAIASDEYTSSHLLFSLTYKAA